MTLWGTSCGHLRTSTCWWGPTCLSLEEGATQLSACGSGQNYVKQGTLRKAPETSFMAVNIKHFNWFTTVPQQCSPAKYLEGSFFFRDNNKPINILTGIDYWLDNLMCNVPELVMCFHVNGIVHVNKPSFYCPNESFYSQLNTVLILVLIVLWSEIWDDLNRGHPWSWELHLLNHGCERHRSEHLVLSQV